MPFLGPGVQAGVLQNADYTATHTTFTVTAGSADFVLDFLSPVSPGNLIRQSAPFSYLTVSSRGNNGATPNVQIYTDIDNTWAGQFHANIQIGWGYTLTNKSTSIFTLTPGGTATYSELNDTAQWGTAVYCARADRYDLTATVGGVDQVRAAFAANGILSGPWEWQPPSVVAYSQDLGKLDEGEYSNVTFAIGYWRQPRSITSAMLARLTLRRSARIHSADV